MFALSQHNFLKHEVDVNPAFDSDNVRRERSAKLNSLVITLLFHGLLVLIFLFAVLKPPFPPLSDSGVFLNLGISAEGMGEVQPEGMATIMQQPEPETSSPSSAQRSQDIVTQDIEEAPVIPKKEDKKKTTTETKTDNKTKTTNKSTAAEAPPKPKAIYPGSQNVPSTGEGTGNTAGDQGKPDGDPKGTEYTGNPGFGGPGPGGAGGSGSPQLGMSGRKIIYFPPITDLSQKTGRVVVNIKVDRNGGVVFAKATQKGSTTTDSYLFKLAEEAAMKTKVNSDPGAAEEQFGTITYTFRVK